MSKAIETGRGFSTGSSKGLGLTSLFSGDRLGSRCRPGVATFIFSSDAIADRSKGIEGIKF